MAPSGRKLRVCDGEFSGSTQGISTVSNNTCVICPTAIILNRIPLKTFRLLHFADLKATCFNPRIKINKYHMPILITVYCFAVYSVCRIHYNTSYSVTATLSGQVCVPWDIDSEHYPVTIDTLTHRAPSIHLLHLFIKECKHI